MGLIAINMLRRLFTLQAISRIEVCRAVDEFYHSGHTVQSLVSFMLESYYTEMLPIANDICDDYDNVITHLRNTSSLDSATFDEVTELATTGLLTHLGFSTREELCSNIADGIDSQSGQPTDSLVSKMVTESLRFLTDVERCHDTTKTLDALADVSFDVASLSPELPEILGIYAALNQTTDLCYEMTKAFSSSRSDLCAVNFDKDGKMIFDNHNNIGNNDKDKSLKYRQKREIGACALKFVIDIYQSKTCIKENVFI